MSECAFTRDICRELIKLNAIILPIVGNSRMPRGWPDRYLHHTRWQGWLEFKAATGRVDLLQRERICALNSRKYGSAFVVREPNRVEDAYGVLIGMFGGTAASLLDALTKLGQHVMTDEQAAEQLRAIIEEHSTDKEAAHMKMDDFLCRLLALLGYEKTVEVFGSIGKWYA